MNWLSFISSVIGSLAWPFVVVVVIIFFRRPILDLIADVRIFRYKGIEVNFGKEIEELENQVREAKLPTQEEARIAYQSTKVVPNVLHVEEIAKFSPRAALVEAWLIIESALREAGIRLGFDVEDKVSANKVVDMLLRTEKIDPRVAESISILRRLRNKSAHIRDYDISTNEAIEFINISFRIAEALRRIN